jgi:hypothetical protein
MRRAWLFVFGLSLFSPVLGCHPWHHTAGVCDGDPPPVWATLYGRPSLAQPAPPVVSPVSGMPLPHGAHPPEPFSVVPGTGPAVPETLRVKPVPTDTSTPIRPMPSIDETSLPRL